MLNKRLYPQEILRTKLAVKQRKLKCNLLRVVLLKSQRPLLWLIHPTSFSALILNTEPKEKAEDKAGPE